MSFRRGFKAEANRIALRIRKQMDLDALAPIDPAEVCVRFEIKLIPLSQLDCDCSSFLGCGGSSFSAVTVPCGWHTAIVHNDSHHQYRQRSNICHELAHCFLGHGCAPPLTASGERTRDGGIEAEANYLAGTLLVVHPHPKAAEESLKAMGFSCKPGYGPLLWRDGKVVARAWVSVATSGKAVVTIEELS